MSRHASAMPSLSDDDGYPAACPITGRPFFMALLHPALGTVPTYGGPYDSYTIPAPEMSDAGAPLHQRELVCERYDHDRGDWVAPEIVPLRIIEDAALIALEERSTPDADALRALRQCYTQLIYCARALENHGHLHHAGSPVHSALKAAQRVLGETEPPTKLSAQLPPASAEAAIPPAPPYQRLFQDAVGALAEISDALGIPAEDAETALGNTLILEAIARLQKRSGSKK